LERKKKKEGEAQYEDGVFVHHGFSKTKIRKGKPPNNLGDV